jgi:hypothetical protein
VCKLFLRDWLELHKVAVAVSQPAQVALSKHTVTDRKEFDHELNQENKQAEENKEEEHTWRHGAFDKTLATAL